MSESADSSDIVTIDGKQYNRVMAEEMARDIELLASIAPTSWAIADNSSLKVDKPAMLSFAEPIRHGYLVDGVGLDEKSAYLIEQFGQPAAYSQFPGVVRVFLPHWNADSLAHLRPSHERAVRKVAEVAPGLAPGWKWHNLARMRDLERIVERSLPQPGYLDELLDHREQEADSLELSGGTLPAHFEGLASFIADGIEAANDVNPLSWSIYALKSGIVLSISGYSVAFIAKERGDWMLFGDPSDPRFEDLASFKQRTDFGGPPVFRVMADERSTLQWIAETFHPSFLEAVRDLAARTRTATPRRAEFQAGILEYVSTKSGRELPMPGYLETNGSTADADVAGADLLAGLDPALLEHMARDIETAHTANPNSWSLYLPRRGEVRLSVKNLNSLSFDSTEVMLVLSGRPDHPMLQHKRQDMTDDLRDGPDAYVYEGFSVVDGLIVLDECQDAHSRAITWLANGVRTRQQWSRVHDPKAVDALSRVVGRELPQPGYLGASPDSGFTPLPTIRDHFAGNGLHYTDAQIATFYTALQTKGFVVLSGISGTGKSKIATGFVEMLPNATAFTQVAPDTTGMISITVKPYMRNYKRIFLPARKVDLLPQVASDAPLDVNVTFDDIQGLGRLSRFNEGDSGVRVLYLKGDIGKAFAQLEIDAKLYVRSVVDEDGELANRLDLLRPEQLQPDTESDSSPKVHDNHLFLSVRPDWRDSTSLLGYYNPLTETYEWTDFLHFIIRAGENYKGPEADRIAWFVILDEMNLAHVEYYFADLLSVLESGRHDVGEKEGWTKEALRLTFPESLDDAPPPQVYLPPNLYIIGTVNMDETTHAFSPKVLDRAFTIELTEVDFSDYNLGVAGPAAANSEAGKAALLRAFSREGRFVRIDKGGDIAGAVTRHEEIRVHLQSLNQLLRRDRFHFGYRVFDEIGQYIANSDLNGMHGSFAEAFDWAVFMKVLPKFTGSAARLRAPLHSVLTWSIDPARTSRDDVVATIARFNDYYEGKVVDAWSEAPAYPTVAGRARDMLVTLERDGFVSFG